MKRIWIFALAGIPLLNGCDRVPATSTTAQAPIAGSNSTSAPAPPPAVLDPRIPTKAQSKLQTIKLWIGPEVMNTELALTEIQDRTGMMFRTNMAENEGMLFVFAEPQRASFWMMNTSLPLSAAYIGPDGNILEIHDLHPYDTNAVVADNDNIQFVLETPQGWFKRHNIGVGAAIGSERGPLPKLFEFHRSVP